MRLGMTGEVRGVGERADDGAALDDGDEIEEGERGHGKDVGYDGEVVTLSL